MILQKSLWRREGAGGHVLETNCIYHSFQQKGSFHLNLNKSAQQASMAHSMSPVIREEVNQRCGHLDQEEDERWDSRRKQQDKSYLIFVFLLSFKTKQTDFLVCKYKCLLCLKIKYIKLTLSINVFFSSNVTFCFTSKLDNEQQCNFLTSLFDYVF